MAKTRRRKKRTHVPNYTDPAKKSDPKTFVFWRGKQGIFLKALEADLRKVMQPNTAEHLKESRKNQLRDFVDIAGPLGVSHFLILTATDTAAYLRIAKTPRGPTMTMRIHEYSLMRDVIATLQRPRQPPSMWKSPPLVVMNNFVGQEELKLATVLFQNLFPAINVQTANLSSCQRVVLLSYDKETRRISFRHYGISAAPSGVTKSVKSLVNRRQLPDMGGLQDVSEFLTKSGYGSESEGEEAAEARVDIAQDMGRGNLASRQSRVRLQEIGPRMELEVVKVEEGMCSGRVLYHSFIQKSATEAAAQQKDIDERERLRAERRRQQAENVAKKQAASKRAAAAAAADPGAKPGKRKKAWWEEELEDADKRKRMRDTTEEDAQYYREEVGEEPEDMPGVRPRQQGSGSRGDRSGHRGGSRGGFDGRGRGRGLPHSDRAGGESKDREAHRGGDRGSRGSFGGRGPSRGRGPMRGGANRARR